LSVASSPFSRRSRQDAVGIRERLRQRSGNARNWLRRFLERPPARSERAAGASLLPSTSCELRRSVPPASPPVASPWPAPDTA
jgi:hypothetical protein